MAWKHKGHEIKLDEETGQFYTRVQDGDSEYKTSIQANSLDELKKKLDSHIKQTIKKGIKLFAKDGYSEDMEFTEIEITSTSADSGHSYWTKDTTTGTKRKYASYDLIKHEPKKVETIIELNNKIRELKKQAEDILTELKLDDDEIYTLLGIKQKQEDDTNENEQK